MKKIIYVIALVLPLVLNACSTVSDPSEAYKGESANSILQSGEEALRDKNYAEAIKRFEALQVQHPFGRQTEVADLHIIYAYYMNNDYLSAEAAADRFIQAHPVDTHIDYAYFMRGVANYYQNLGIFERVLAVDLATRDRSQIKKSFADFATIVKRYPESQYANPAYHYMVYLRNLLASHQLEVANYYFDHKAYLAAINRANEVVLHYQGAPVVPDALVVMAKSYQKLHLTERYNEVIRILQVNYPNIIYLKEMKGQ